MNATDGSAFFFFFGQFTVLLSTPIRQRALPNGGPLYRRAFEMLFNCQLGIDGVHACTVLLHKLVSRVKTSPLLTP